MKSKLLAFSFMLMTVNAACSGDGGTSPMPDAEATLPVLNYGNTPPCTKNPSGTLNQNDPIFCVEITGNTDIEVAQTSNLQCIAYNITGRVLSATTFSWSVSSTTLATITPSGAYAAIQGVKGTGEPSSQWVYCSARNASTPGGVHGTRVLTVRAPVRTVVASPAQVSVPAGLTAQLSAVAKDAGGNVLTGRFFAWSSSNPAVATVSATGIVTGVAVGTATVTAVSEGISSAPVQVQVTTAPQVAALLISDRNRVLADSTTIITVDAKDANGIQFRPPPVTLTFSAPSAVVDGEVVTALPQRAYRVRGLLSDHVTVTASVNGVQDTAWLSIAPGLSIGGPVTTPAYGSYTWTATVSGCNGGCTYQWIQAASNAIFRPGPKAPILSTGPSLTMMVNSTSQFYVGVKVTSNGKETYTFYKVN